MILLAVLIWYVLNRTAFGRHIYATGDDPDARGWPASTLAGRCSPSTPSPASSAPSAAWVLIGRIGAASPLAGQTANLDSITAVVIGGTSLFGGRGSIVGTLVGALIVGVFRNGLGALRSRRALAGIRRRPADHRRGDTRPMDPEGVAA